MHQQFVGAKMPWFTSSSTDSQALLFSAITVASIHCRLCGNEARLIALADVPCDQADGQVAFATHWDLRSTTFLCSLYKGHALSVHSAVAWGSVGGT